MTSLTSRSKSGQFVQGLFGKEVYNTLITFFYKDYLEAGFDFQFLKCYNVKCYRASHNAVQEILDETDLFLTQDEREQLRSAMKYRKTKQSRKDYADRFFRKNSRTSKYFKRYLKVSPDVYPNNNAFIFRYTAIHVDSSFNPIVTLIQFRARTRVKLTKAEVEAELDFQQINQLWCYATDEVIAEIGRAGSFDLSDPSCHEAVLTEVQNRSFQLEGGRLVELTDLLAALTRDHEALQEEAHMMDISE